MPGYGKKLSAAEQKMKANQKMSSAEKAFKSGGTTRPKPGGPVKPKPIKRGK